MHPYLPALLPRSGSWLCSYPPAGTLLMEPFEADEEYDSDADPDHLLTARAHARRRRARRHAISQRRELASSAAPTRGVGSPSHRSVVRHPFAGLRRRPPRRRTARAADERGERVVDATEHGAAKRRRTERSASPVSDVLTTGLPPTDSNVSPAAGDRLSQPTLRTRLPPADGEDALVLWVRVLHATPVR